MNEQRLPATLKCGAAVGELMEQVAEGHADDPTSHQAECSYCQLTLSRLAASWRTVERLRVERAEPSLRLLAGVMRRVRSELDDRRVELSNERGATRVSVTVLTALAFWAAAAVPGVRHVLSARPRSSDLQTVETRSGRTRLVSPNSLRIDLELSVDYGFGALLVAAEVRRAVVDQVWAMAGLEVAGVNLTILDVG